MTRVKTRSSPDVSRAARTSRTPRRRQARRQVVSRRQSRRCRGEPGRPRRGQPESVPRSRPSSHAGRIADSARRGSRQEERGEGRGAGSCSERPTACSSLRGSHSISRRATRRSWLGTSRTRELKLTTWSSAQRGDHDCRALRQGPKHLAQRAIADGRAGESDSIAGYS